jgi:hypothetical protein
MIRIFQSRHHNHGGVMVKILVVIAIVIAALVFLFGRVIVEKAVSLKAKLVMLLEHRDVFPETAWGTRTAGEVSLEAPCAITEGPPLLDLMPPEARALLVAADSFQGDASARFFRIKVTRLEYVPGTTLSLDKAAAGRIRDGASATGDPDPKFTITPTTVDGLEARRVSYRQESSTPIHIDVVVAQKDTVLWLVQVISASPQAQPDVQRLLQSVHIKPLR